MITIELTNKEAELLKDVLNLDLDSIGYDEDEIDILEDIDKRIEIK